MYHMGGFMMEQTKAREVKETETVFYTTGGTYDVAKSYRRLTVVRHNGASWQSVKSVPEGVAPAEDSEYWQLFAKDGTNGADGDTISEGEGISIEQTQDGSKKISLSDECYTTTEKEKLQGIADNANAYTHPTHPAKAAGMYLITVDEQGHISAATPVTKADITALGIASTEAATPTAGYGISVTQKADGSSEIGLSDAKIVVSETQPTVTEGKDIVWVVPPET